MADPRVLTFEIPVNYLLETETDPDRRHKTDAVQIQFSRDRINWTDYKVDAEPIIQLIWTQEGDSDSQIVEVEIDGVNGTEDDDNNPVSASTPPNWYRYRTRTTVTTVLLQFVSAKWGNWGQPFLFPSAEDAIHGMKTQLKDPSLSGNAALLDDSDYYLNWVNAIEAFERLHPRMASQTYDLTADEQSYDLPTEWEYGFSSIEQCEYPVGEEPRLFIYADWLVPDEQVSQWRFLRVFPDATEQARLYFTAKHYRDGSTIRASQFQSVVMWATGSAAQQIMAYRNQFGDVLVGADYMMIDPRIKLWGQIAKDYKTQAERIWGSSATGVRTHVPLYDDHGRLPASVWGAY